MLSGLLAVALALDGGVPDAGFTPVVLDVHHGAVWTNLPDGGASDVPTLVLGGTWADDETSLMLGRSEARGTAERTVTPDVDTHTLTLVGGVLFIIGALSAGALICGTGHCK